MELLFKLKNDLIDIRGRPIYVNERFRSETTKQVGGFVRDLKEKCWDPTLDLACLTRPARELMSVVNKQVQAGVFRETLPPFQAIDLGRALQKKEWSL
jgi:hypothetical protein